MITLREQKRIITFLITYANDITEEYEAWEIESQKMRLYDNLGPILQNQQELLSYLHNFFEKVLKKHAKAPRAISRAVHTAFIAMIEGDSWSRDLRDAMEYTFETNRKIGWYDDECIDDMISIINDVVDRVKHFKK